MDQYRLLTFAVVIILVIVQTRRKPEEIMRVENPKTDSFITARAEAEVARVTKEIAKKIGFKVYKSEHKRIVLTTGASFFGWGNVLSVEVESPNDWSSRVKLSLYSKAETGYGNHFIRSKRLKRLIEDLRKELRAGQE